MRGVLMALGVVLHSARLYDTEAWHISDGYTSAYFNYLVETIHVFRMPAFFMIAGFFSVMSIEKYGVKRFLGKRWLRLFVPMLSTALLINPVQFYLCEWFNSMNTVPFNMLSLANLFSMGQKWASHLWFLNYLLIYVTGFALMYVIVAGRWPGAGLRKAAQALNTKGLYLLSWPLLMVVVYKSYQVSGIPAHYPHLLNFNFLGIFTLGRLIFYFAFFVFGLCLFADSNLKENFGGPSLFKVCAFALIFPFLIMDFDFVGSWLLALYSELVLVFFLCELCFFIFKTVLNKPSSVHQYFSEASYSIYLFHQVLVIMYGGLLLKFELSIYLKFIVVFFLTLVTTLLIHHFIILKNRFCRFLFNGKYA